jgi:predicted DNA-binding transcriptional regulator AlpA
MIRLLTKAEAAERCRVSLAAFDAHVRPALTPKKIGRRVLFLESDIDAWAETESRSSAAPAKRGPSRAQPKT